MPENIHLGVLYSQPLAWKDNQGNLHAVDVLDFDKERELLTESLGQAGRAIRVQMEAATVHNLSTMVS